MADQENWKPAPDLIHEDTGTAAPLVYFDIIGACGAMHGSIEIELATRILVPKTDGSTEMKFLSSGRLRCSSIDAALKMPEQSQADPAALSRLN